MTLRNLLDEFWEFHPTYAEYSLASNILNDERFLEWSGSSSPDKHHYGTNGLLLHTLEVTKLCFSTAKTLNL